MAQGSHDLNEFSISCIWPTIMSRITQDLQPEGGIYPLGLYLHGIRKCRQYPQKSTVSHLMMRRTRPVLSGVMKAPKHQAERPVVSFTTPNDIDASASEVTAKAVEAAKVANALGDPVTVPEWSTMIMSKMQG